MIWVLLGGAGYWVVEGLSGVETETHRLSAKSSEDDNPEPTDY